MASPFVTHIPVELYDPLKTWLCSKGFQLSQPTFTIFQAKSNSKPATCCTLYASGKFVVQGKGSKEFITFHLEPEFLFIHQITSPAFDPSHIDLSLRIGTDESGKGDFFGPLCIAGALPKTEQNLLKLYENSAIRDSKTIKKAKISALHREIEQLCFIDCVILVPEKYNALYQQFQNLNHLLAWGHATVINNLANKSSKVAYALSDQFAKSESTLLSALRKKNSTIQLIQRTKAEEDPVVAAASIVARSVFLSTMHKLEQQYGVSLPLGASQSVKDTARKIFQEHGLLVLSQLCKTHFKTFQEVQ